MNEQSLPDGTVGSEHLGARVFCISAPDAQTLADRLALVLGEHMDADDEIHLTYNASNRAGNTMQGGRDGGAVRHTRSWSSSTARSSYFDRLTIDGSAAPAYRAQRATARSSDTPANSGA
jgi:hypothetical protein